MKLKSQLLTAIFFSIFIIVTQVLAREPSKSVNEFTIEPGLLPEDIATYPELKTWALYQYYELDEDESSISGISDSVCRMIPETGLRFLLEKNPEHLGRVYLYLDMTKYHPQAGSRFNTRKLSIYVNGRLKKEIYTSKKHNFENPVEIPIERNEFPDSLITIELVPSKNTTGRFWGIWDAYLRENRPEKEFRKRISRETLPR